jgi:hypothetical protein
MSSNNRKPVALLASPLPSGTADFSDVASLCGRLLIYRTNGWENSFLTPSAAVPYRGD